MQPNAEKQIVAKMLQAKINAMQGLGKSSGEPAKTGLAPFDAAFPGNVFPTGAIHEFVSYEPTHAASTSGFITALAGKFMKEGSLCLWIGTDRKIFPSGLKLFGIQPDRVVFIHISKQKDKLWIIEEALKCKALTVVVGEMTALGFTESRRLQLAVERSGVIGFIHRFQPRVENAVACTSRWKIIPLESTIPDGLPGVGHSRWDVQLLKVKNGKPNSWQISWVDGKFIQTNGQHISVPSLHERHAG